jgi:hypothetical protein
MNIFAVFFAWRPSTLRAITFCGVCPFLVGWGGFYYNNRHIPPWIAISLMFIGGISGAAGVKQTLINFHKSNKTATVWGVIVFIAVTFLTAGDVFFELKSGQGDAKPYPHFSFSFFSTSRLDNLIELTNDSLQIIQFGTPVKVDWLLYMENRSDQSNIDLNLFIKNDSSIAAEDLEITVKLDKRFNGVPNTDWIPNLTEDNRVIEDPPGVFTTNKLESWTYFAQHSLLSRNGLLLPSIKIFQLSEHFGTVGILARTKDSPSEMISFNLWFPTNMPFVIRKPFFILGTNNAHGILTAWISPKKLNELAAQNFISPK